LRPAFYIIPAFLIYACADLIVKPASTNLNMQDFEAAWNRVNEVYPFLDLKKLIGIQYIPYIVRGFKRQEAMSFIQSWEIYWPN